MKEVINYEGYSIPTMKSTISKLRHEKIEQELRVAQETIEFCMNHNMTETEIPFEDTNVGFITVEDLVNKVQDVLRQAGYQVTRNANVTYVTDFKGEIFCPFTLTIKWRWEE